MIPEHVSAHVIVGSKTLVMYCGHCEGAFRLALPMPIREVMDGMERYSARHRLCVAREPVKA